MALKKCGKCGGKVSADATSCPRCGAPDPAAETAAPAKSSVSLGSIVIGLIVVGVAAAFFATHDDSSTGSSSSSDNAPAVATSIQTCDADDPGIRGATIEVMSWQDAADLCTVMYGAMAAYPTPAQLRSFEQTVYVLKSDGYTKANRDIGLEAMSFANDLGRMDGGTKMQSAFDDLVKIYKGTSGIVTPRDMIDLLRPMGQEQGSKLSDDGLFGLAAMVKEQKIRDGQ